MIRVIREHGVRDERVLEAMAGIRRHLFIPDEHRALCDSYGDHPCPIGHMQTISQPYIVAYMTERLNLKPGERVLEIGTGSGYQSAVLAGIGAEVFTVEIIPELADHARKLLAEEGCGSVQVSTGDGYAGWPEHSPYDGILVTCAPPEVPEALTRQLAEGGRMILPIGAGAQRLVMLRKQDGCVRHDSDIGVRFVPMVRARTDGGAREEVDEN